MYEGDSRKTLTEYDILTEIDDIPTLWEVKLETGNRPANRLPSRRALSNNQINKLFRPLTEYYQGRKDFAYVFVGAQERIGIQYLTQDRFIKKGGIIVPFPVSTFELRRRMVAMKFNSNT